MTTSPLADALGAAYQLHTKNLLTDDAIKALTEDISADTMRDYLSAIEGVPEARCFITHVYRLFLTRALALT